MILQNKGIQTESFYIPPFELKAGELIVLHLFNGAHFYETEMFLKNIFCDNTKDKNIQIYGKMTFVEHFSEPQIRRIFCPVTVGEYLKKNSNLNSLYSSKIYEPKWINKKTKVNTLSGNPRRVLSLYATLSKTNNIIFDVVGQDPIGAKETYEIVKNEVKKRRFSNIT